MLSSTDWEGIKGSDRLDSREIQQAYDDLMEELEIEERQAEEDEQEFIDAVDELRGELSEWDYGAFLIAEDDFEDYAREFASDIGAITGDEAWPANCIDWEKAASELQHDYTSVSFLGYDYLTRST